MSSLILDWDESDTFLCPSMRAFFCLCSLRISPEETSENVCECDVRWNRHRCFIENYKKPWLSSSASQISLCFHSDHTDDLLCRSTIPISPLLTLRSRPLSFTCVLALYLSLSVSFAISLEMSCLRKCQPKSVWGWSRCSGRAHLCKNKPVNGAIVFFFSFDSSR